MIHQQSIASLTEIKNKILEESKKAGREDILKTAEGLDRQIAKEKEYLKFLEEQKD